MGSREPRDRDRSRWEAPADPPTARWHPGDAETIAQRAADYVAGMTGKEPEGIVSLKRTGESRWQVGVEVVETRRIPDSTDILAVYEAELDTDGELVSYRRTRRYSRCQLKETP